MVLKLDYIVIIIIKFLEVIRLNNTVLLTRMRVKGKKKILFLSSLK